MSKPDSKFCDICGQVQFGSEAMFDMHEHGHWWICKNCFMDWIREKYPSMDEEMCLDIFGIADELHIDYQTVRDILDNEYSSVVDRRIDDLKERW